MSSDRDVQHLISRAFALMAPPQRRLADDHNRLVEVDVRTGAALRSVHVGHSAHLYASYVLSAAEAAVWCRAWQAEDARSDGVEAALQRLLFLAEVRVGSLVHCY